MALQRRLAFGERPSSRVAGFLCRSSNRSWAGAASQLDRRATWSTAPPVARSRGSARRRSRARDLGVESVALPRLHGDAPREGAQQPDVALGVVDRLPVERADVHGLEEAGVVDLGAALLEPAGTRPDLAGREPPRQARRRRPGSHERKDHRRRGTRGWRSRTQGGLLAAALPMPSGSGVQGLSSARRWRRRSGRSAAPAVGSTLRSFPR